MMMDAMDGNILKSEVPDFPTSPDPSPNCGEDHRNHCGKEVKNKKSTSDREWDEEREHFRRVFNAFRSYRGFSMARIFGTESFINSFPEHHQKLLEDYSAHLNSLLPCLDVNQGIFDLMIENVNIFQNSDEYHFTEPNNVVPGAGSCEHQHKIASEIERCYVVLKQIVRDWTVEGLRERTSTYKPILEELEVRFPISKSRGDTRVLLPGAGLGRLAYEIVRRGFCTEGNEFSVFMLFASNFILNKCLEPNLYKCYPWIHQHTNVLFHIDQTRPVFFPDVNPSDMPPNSKFTMTAGDFLEVYEKPEQQEAWDCIVTCFFIDCGKNIVAFLERIFYCLKENGVWINLGPLMYHYADTAEQKSIEPPYDFLAAIIRKLGFKIEKEILDLPTGYSDNQRSMLSFTYKSVFLVCTKTPK